MTNATDISLVTNVIDLHQLVEDAAFERNCELEVGTSYLYAAEWFEAEAQKTGNGKESMIELAEILRAAEKRWHVIEA